MQDVLYQDAAAQFGPALARLARAYEPDSDRCRDLLQEIHVALWRSFASFDRRCSLRTWTYRVAHNTATSQVSRRRDGTRRLVELDELELAAVDIDADDQLDRRMAVDRLLTLIQGLRPLDRQVILLYLEGTDAVSIGEVTGLSPGAITTKVHRIKAILARRFREGGRDGK